MEKQLKLIIAFHNVTEIMRFEKKCKEASKPGRMIPVPRAVSTSCGFCWMADLSAQKELEDFFAETGIKPVAFHQVEMNV